MKNNEVILLRSAVLENNIVWTDVNIITNENDHTFVHTSNWCKNQQVLDGMLFENKYINNKAHYYNILW